jgi:Outer membrane protein beta-barrel domain
MKKIVLIAFGLLFGMAVFAQDDSLATKIKKQVTQMASRSNDHFLFQLGVTKWAGKPDSINTGGFSRSLNFYFMFDFPFKTNPKLSMAFGPGISTDQIYFKKTFIDIKAQSAQLPFTNQADTNHFKRSKLITAYVEAPIEFRYVAHPDHSDRSFKFALGVKVGTMLGAHTKYKELQTRSNSTINNYSLKESSKRFFNSNRLSAMARVGKGHFSLYGTYQITALFKEGVAAEIRPYSIGITLSGL